MSGAGTAVAAPVFAAASIDWGTLAIEVLGEGGLIPIDGPLVINHAVITDAHENPIGASKTIGIPAFAANSRLAPTAAIAAFDADGGSAMTAAGVGSAHAASSGLLSLVPVGWGTALVTVDYGLATGGEPYLPLGTAAASVELEAALYGFGAEAAGQYFHDDASLFNIGGIGGSIEAGVLALAFPFSETVHELITLGGTASSFSAGVLAAPIPASLPLMLGALGFIGMRMRTV
jgi:hypothetical protein